MSQSSNPKLLSQEVKEAREAEIEEKSFVFLRQIANNMCLFEGINGKYDLAFGVKRKPIIARVLRRLAKELEDESAL